VKHWVVTGMSGAGKSVARTAMEGLGIRVVDNLPIELLGAFVRGDANGDRPGAAIVDSRQHWLLDHFDAHGAMTIYLDARDDVLRRRLSESTHKHPLHAQGGVEVQIAAERDLLAPMRATADVVIDTSDLSPHDLEEEIRAIVGSKDGAETEFVLRISSFGFKFGVARDADVIFDARGLRNPFWDDALRALDGRDARVRDYVFGDENAAAFLDGAQAMTEWYLRVLPSKQRTALHVAVGCTGGRHRSVAVAEELAKRNGGAATVLLLHRDVEVPDLR
jgi:UPF0042 nucleotide-binding protein